MNTATCITLFRFLLTPVVVFFYMTESGAWHWISMSLFLFAGLSDWLDGYFARCKNQETLLGKLLDPLADKVLVISVLLTVSYYHQSSYMQLLAALVILRDIFVSSIREWQAGLAESVDLHPSRIAKFKTVMQMSALTILVGATTQYPHLLYFGTLLLTISVVLSYVSFLDYVKKVYPVLTFVVKKQ